MCALVNTFYCSALKMTKEWVTLPNQINFRKSSGGWGGLGLVGSCSIQNPKIIVQILDLYKGFFWRYPKKLQCNYTKMRGRGPKAVWNFSENSSDLVPSPVPKCQPLKEISELNASQLFTFWTRKKEIQGMRFYVEKVCWATVNLFFKVVFLCSPSPRLCASAVERSSQWGNMLIESWNIWARRAGWGCCWRASRPRYLSTGRRPPTIIIVKNPLLIVFFMKYASRLDICQQKKVTRPQSLRQKVMPKMRNLWHLLICNKSV